MPTDAIRIPKQPLMIPFNRLSPLTEAITESPKIASAKYSGAPKFIAIFPIWGAKNNSQHALISPPTVDAVSAVLSAFPGNPFRQQGYPSKSVAAAAFVPGVLIKIALIEPPKLEPKKIAVSSKSAGTGSSINVNGRSTVIARFPFIPGMAPKIIPTNIPRFIIIRFSIVSRFIKA